MNEETLLNAKLNDVAIRCFRNVADRDYVSARMNYRAFLMPQFHWSAEQAIEKYLKCILFLNRIKAKNVRHDLLRALNLAKKLPFDIRMSDSTRKLITHLDNVAKFRYLEGSHYTFGPKFFELDRAVWEIRRYCRPINTNITLPNGETKSLLDFEIQAIEDAEKRSPHKFKINGGWLEKVIADKNHAARKDLIWQNAYFGSRARRKVFIPNFMASENTPFANFPEIMDEVERYIYVPLPKAVKQQLKKMAEDGTSY